MPKVIASAWPLSIIPADHRAFLLTVRNRRWTQIRRVVPPLCAPLIPVLVKARVFQIGQSVSVLGVVSAISAQEAARRQHGRRTHND